MTRLECSQMLTIIADIRQAIGDNGKLMLSELPEQIEKIKHNSDRYEAVRKLNAHQFCEIYQRNIKENIPFDTLIDELLNKAG